MVSLLLAVLVQPARPLPPVHDGTRLDSAGVIIISHLRLARVTAPFEVRHQPLTTMGGIEADPALELRSTNPFPVVKPLSDGRWVVMDWSRLLLYDQAGRPVATIGRPGRGPEEFGQLREVCVTPGDSLVVIGYADRRITVVDVEGTHIRTVLAGGPVWSDPCFTDGTVLVRAAHEPNQRSALPRDQAAVLDLTFEGRRVDWRRDTAPSLGRFPGASRDLHFPDIGNAVVAEDRIYVGNGRRPEYEIRTAQGRLERIVRWEAPAFRITTAMRGGGNGAIRPSGPPSQRVVLPFYRTLKVDALGRVWVQGHGPSDASRHEWFVFGTGGNYLGRVTLPPLAAGRIDITWIGADRILLAWRDEDGAPRLSLHAIVPR